MIADIQIAVADRINSHAEDNVYSQPIAAEVRFLPEDDLSTLEGIKVYVVPSSIEQELLTRKSEENACTVDVATIKRLVATDRTSADWEVEVRGMLQLVDEIAGSLRFTEAAGATWQKNQIAPLYDPKRLRETNVFLSILRVTYWRSR